MFNKIAARTFKSTDVNYRLLVPLLPHALAVQMVIAITRVTTSYRVLELDLPVVWLGVISAAFALVPVFLAVWVGRFMDRGNDAVVAWIGSALLVVGCAGLLASSSSAALLLVFTAVLGIGHLFLIASQQIICVRCSGEHSRESVFGNYVVACAIGQGVGPYVVGWAGGSATVPPTQFLFAIGLITAVVSLVFAAAMRPTRVHEKQANGEGVVPVRELLRVPGLMSVLMASMFTVTAQDLILIYLPLLGTERSIDVKDIGALLTVRAAASMVSRLLYSRLIGRVGRVLLMVTSLLAGGFAFAWLAVPLPLLAMYLATAVLGFALGISSTLTITSVVALTTAGTRGTASSLRLMGNRIGQVALPFGASLVAAATGVGGIFGVVAISLVASGAAVHWSRPDK